MNKCWKNSNHLLIYIFHNWFVYKLFCWINLHQVLIPYQPKHWKPNLLKKISSKCQNWCSHTPKWTKLSIATFKPCLWWHKFPKVWRSGLKWTGRRKKDCYLPNTYSIRRINRDATRAVFVCNLNIHEIYLLVTNYQIFFLYFSFWTSQLTHPIHWYYNWRTCHPKSYLLLVWITLVLSSTESLPSNYLKFNTV